MRASREETIFKLGNRRSDNANTLRRGAENTIRKINAELHRREMLTLGDLNAQ